LLLLLYRPNFLFEIGFQLSYLAVLGILAIQPLLSNLWSPKFWIFKKLWAILTVSIAAQIGVLPLSLFYFHQFPGLFFITNLIILPILGLILLYGFVVVILSSFDLTPEYLIQLYEYLIKQLLSFIKWISSFENFIIKDIPFDILLLCTSYLMIISLTRLVHQFSYRNILSFGITIIIFQVGLMWNGFQYDEDELIVFQKSRHSIISLRKSNEVIIFKDSLTSTNTITPYLIGSFIKKVRYNEPKSLHIFGKDTLLVIDSLGVYQNLSFKPSIIVLTQSPKINLDRVIDSISPRLIVADGSNYKSYVLQWDKTCKKRKLPFHNTYEMGAYILKE
ncbi:MAG: ComEC/Rec2 family competence protein, partial [Flavobacteriaceae bacterium]|nr:ComEC/Rec2 family competence protein [Flavobacteriaceae bacterium]